jgi:hypothetical protein
MKIKKPVVKKKKVVTPSNKPVKMGANTFFKGNSTT